MKNPFLRSALAAAAAAGLAMGLTACSDDGTTDAVGDSDDVVKIVTSTKVWADVADAVVGDADGVEIQPIIESNDLDPHSYQPTAADMALVEQADVLLAGGGHYDAWLTDAASSDSSAIILTAIEGDGFDGHGHGEDDHGDHDHDHAAHEDEDEAEADDHAGHDHDHGHDHEVNEHIWYNTDAVTSLASTLADEINAHWDLDASDEDVVKRMEDIEDRKADLTSAKTAQTHPLADDIIADTKIEDITPEGYRSATLSESEPAAADVAEMLELIESGDLDFLIDSPQTRNHVSERLMQAAQSKGLRIINVYESPDSNENFFDLYDRILDSLEKK
ncbi:metal ABC transporter solute-binding protein, Zn/Mn family [Corynebacterium freneyi]|uniref:metal ABC transporter solute-binding protein, Zn/Mn family n=1 Tax=Corynebacterium freneyi TaxID=134034 RepID=UPI001CCCC084|nr:zinc ABC transporter substrate-binding protein [Corynebacterium freneyi]UBI02092.1 zinc ABC transporter substrate-binding protein [Corynebacterium freneyi]